MCKQTKNITALCIYICIIYFFLSNILNAQTLFEQYTQLLHGYILNDSEIEKLAIDVQRKQITVQRTNIQSGVQVTLSSGDIEMRFQEESALLYTAPSVKISVPKWNNSGIDASIPFDTTFASNTETKSSIVGSTVTFSTDIISSTAKKHQLSLIKAQRALLESKRKLQLRVLVAEKEFLTKLKKLYVYAADASKAQEDMIKAQQDFQLIEFQGYAKNSAKYRTSELKIKSAQRTQEEKQRLLSYELDNFAVECGIPFTELPYDIPESQMLSLNDFPKEKFINLEKSLWNYYVNQFDRDLYTPFTLRGSTGYRYRKVTSSSSVYHDLQVGMSLGYKGFNLNAKFSIPVNKPTSPAVSLSFNWTVNNLRLEKLSNEEKLLDIREEQLAILNAENLYIKFLIDYEQKRNDLLWQKMIKEEEYGLYVELAQDVKQWYESGIVNDLEYRKSQNDLNFAEIENIKARIDRHIYNLDIQLLFSEVEK